MAVWEKFTGYTGEDVVHSLFGLDEPVEVSCSLFIDVFSVSYF